MSDTTSNFVFQLESMSIDVSYNEKPLYDALETDDILTGDATINLQIPAAELRAIFKFAVDSSDIDDVSANDIKYATNSSKWQGLDIFGDAHAGKFETGYTFDTGRDVSGTDLNGDSSDIKRGVVQACVDGENSGTGTNGGFDTHMNGAGEFVRHLASEITGGHNSSDIFSNEAALLQAVKDLSGTVNSLIRQKISIAGKGVDTTGDVLGDDYRHQNDNYNITSASIGGGETDGTAAGSISNNLSILGRTLLLQLLSGGRDPSGGNVASDGLADGRARVYKVLQERDWAIDASGYAADVSGIKLMPIPVDAGDIIKFNVVVRPNGQNDVSNNWHSLGTNVVHERRYLVNLHLTGKKCGSTHGYMTGINSDWTNA